MRSFNAAKILLLATFLLTTVSPAHAAKPPKTRAILVPFVCQPAGQAEVSARFVNSNHSNLLSLRTNPSSDGSYAGGVCDRIDGLPFITLDMDVSGGCQSGFNVVFFGSDPITTDFTASTATCADAIMTPGKGGYTHLHFTPESFGFASSPALIQLYIIQNATSGSTHNVLVKNVVVNSGTTTAVFRLSGCQL